MQQINGIMNRKKFLKNTVLGITAAAAAPTAIANVKNEESSLYDRMMKQVGFNHLPNNDKPIMKTILHKANTRGNANHGWLQANFSFSFANYYNPQRMHFGVLRVLNDDYIAGGGGFGTHPHDNMEIITIPLEGALEHKDSMGNSGVIKRNEVQVMSAGTGVLHSEFNHSKTETANTLQLWVFPNKRDVQPRYDQLKFDPLARKNQFQQILSPNPDDEGVWIHQDAWFHMGNFDAGKKVDYTIRKKGNGVYAFIVDGDVNINGQELNKRDALGIWDVEKLNISSNSKAEILLLEVPMQI